MYEKIGFVLDPRQLFPPPDTRREQGMKHEANYYWVKHTRTFTAYVLQKRVK
jgi:hypothetical protein